MPTLLCYRQRWKFNEWAGAESGWNRKNFRASGIQRDVQFLGQQARIERAAGKISTLNLDGRNFPAAVIDSQHQTFRLFAAVNINFPEGDAALLQKELRSPAIGAPFSMARYLLPV